MTNPSDPQARPPLDADDPRLSEWIDGRLSAAEAAEVERAVLGSPALTRLVDDLRAIKEAARQVPTASPPAGFADRVMEAALSGGRAAAATDAAADRAVVQEWRSIETERIAEERAEAEADRFAAPGPQLPASGRSWPWLTIAAALAAGLLVALVLNRPQEGPQEIAALAAKPEPDNLAAAVRREASPAEEAAAPPLPAPVAGPALPPPTAVAARSLEANGRLREQAKAAADAAGPDLPVVIRVASWTEFDRLLEAHGIESMPIEGRSGDDRADESRDWTLELSGPSAGLEALLAAAGKGFEKRQAAAGEELERKAEVALAAPAAKQAEETQLRGRASNGRLRVRLVIEEPASSKPAGPVPAEGGEP